MRFTWTLGAIGILVLAGHAGALSGLLRSDRSKAPAPKSAVQVWQLVQPRDGAYKVAARAAAAIAPATNGLAGAQLSAAADSLPWNASKPAATAVSDTGATEAEDYLPRGKLSISPQPMEELRVPFPPDIVGIVDMRVPVSLFIDEAGIVRRVRLDGPELAPAFARAILDTFLFARFRPGELHSVPVRSLMRIEIDFRASPNSAAQSGVNSTH